MLQKTNSAGDDKAVTRAEVRDVLITKFKLIPHFECYLPHTVAAVRVRVCLLHSPSTNASWQLAGWCVARMCR